MKKVIIEIEDQTEIQALGEQVHLLKETGLQVEYDGKESEQGTGTERILIFTDNPDAARQKYGHRVCILLYITERNRQKWWKGIAYAVISVRGLTPEFLEQVYRRHVGVPWDILETERLLIREMTEDDLEDLYRIHDQPGIEGFVAPLETDREKQLEILRSYIRKVYPIFGFGMWMVVEKASGRCIGRVGLQMESSIRNVNEKMGTQEEACPELGFIMEVSAQRKGYCMEACRAVLKYGFEELGMERICAVVTGENLPSRIFCTMLGGKPEVRDGQYLFFWGTMDMYKECRRTLDNETNTGKV